MRQDAWRAYLEMVLGITEASRKRAMKVAQKVVGKGELTAEQLQTLADDMVKASAANREALAKLVRVELDRALGRVGLASADQVNDLADRVRGLEARLGTVDAGPAAALASSTASSVSTESTESTASSESTESAGPATVSTPATAAGGVTPTVKKSVAKKAVKKPATVPSTADSGGSASVVAASAPAASTTTSTTKPTKATRRRGTEGGS